MWRSLWRSIDRFSLQHFKYVLDEVRRIKVVDRSNREVVIDMLQSVVEIVTYGDRHDPMIFECFMEYQVMAEFLRILKISRNSRIEAPLLQYLSIMIQNIESDQAIYYCFSNGYINNIIAHPYKFEGGDLAPYYVSFLRAVSSKLTGDTLCLLVKIDGENKISFPLYSEALKFAKHGEKMIQTAVRAITLNIYNVSDDLVYQFVTTHPISRYFSDLAESIREQYVHLDTIVHAKEETGSSDRVRSLHLENEKVVDDLYYFKDLLSIGESRLKRSVLQNLLNWLVLPALLPVSKLRQDKGPSVITSLYMVAGLLQVVGGKALVNFIAIILLYPYMVAEITDASANNRTSKSCDTKSLSSYMSELEGLVFSDSDSVGGEDINGNSSFGQLLGCGTSNDFSLSLSEAVITATGRAGVFSNIVYENTTLMLASLYLLLVLAENKDLDCTCAKIINSSVMLEKKIINALLMVLLNQPQVPVLVYWHTGWFFQKLLAFQGWQLGDDNLLVFNTSYGQTRERFQKELEGCWFDYIPDTLTKEWERCKAVLGEPCEHKDPMFLLELAIHQQKDNGNSTSSSFSWQRMVDTVKAFVLHLQLKAFILKEDVPENPVVELESNPTTESGKHASDHHSSASFGSQVPLGSAFPCRIAFSNAGVRDIYVVPVPTGKSGKLLLMEKHPFRSQRGVVIAIAPLPGLSPKIDEDHPTWLHLQVREFDPTFDASKSRSSSSSSSSSRSHNNTTNTNNKRSGNHQNKNAVEGRWTLGFSNAEACTAARGMILEETSKQRSFIEMQLAPLLQIATVAPNNKTID